MEGFFFLGGLRNWLHPGARARGDKDTLEFLGDLEFPVQPIIDRVQPFTMTGPERIAALCRSLAYLENRGIPGDIVECGVWRGGSMMAAALTLQKLGSWHRNLYLFDTFTGMSPPAEVDRDLHGRPARDLLGSSSPEGDLFRAVCPLEEVKKNLLGTGYDPERIFFIEGRVEETLPRTAPEKIALLRLDTDWYASTHHELTHLYPRLVEGGVLIIDDYGHWQGSRLAVDEYFARNQITLNLQPIDYTGRLVIKPPCPDPDTISSSRFISNAKRKPYLNIGCGGRWHPRWFNLDLHPQDPSIVKHHVIEKPLPFADGSLEVVYHSHLLEHLPRSEAAGFLQECHRVLQKGGIIRVVVPDLEQIARLYLEALEGTRSGRLEDSPAGFFPGDTSKYDWILLEMYDQVVREKSGGAMLEFLQQKSAKDAAFAFERLGADGRLIRAHLQQPEASARETPNILQKIGSKIRNLFSRRSWREKMTRWILGNEYKLLETARFRRQGEVHQWMYDRHSLSCLLANCGFQGIEQVEAGQSRIPGWEGFHLDLLPEGIPAKPDSLYVEAVKR